MERLPDTARNMYENEAIAKTFALLENNPGHEEVSAIVDEICQRETQDFRNPLAVAELGGGAHPDRYHQLFERLLMHPQGHIDWVDASGPMLALADEALGHEPYQARREILHFVHRDMLDYLGSVPRGSLDLILLKYAFNYLPGEDVELLFGLVKQALKYPGRLIATVSSLSGQLRSSTEHARLLYQGQEFPLEETRALSEGERYTVKFFRKSGDPAGGFLPGASTDLFYHSRNKLENLAQRHGFESVLGNWKNFYPHRAESRDQDILILRN